MKWTFAVILALFVTGCGGDRITTSDQNDVRSEIQPAAVQGELVRPLSKLAAPLTITPVDAIFGADVLDYENYDCDPDCPPGIFNPAYRLIDGSGLDGSGAVLSQVHSGAFIDPDNGRHGPDEANFKTTRDAVSPSLFNLPIDLDLGGIFDLTDVHIWNFTHSHFLFMANGRDAKDVEIFLSTDGTAYTSAGTVTLTSSGILTETAQTFALTGTASHVRLHIRSWYGPADQHEVGLSEIRFTGTPVSTDSDGDGINDDADQCAATPEGAAVDGNGCSGIQNIDVAAPCDGDWKNHGAYVSAVSHAVQNQVAAGLLTEEEGGAIVSEAARSDCGHKKSRGRGKAAG